mmetsp:Transcript_9583/g.28750  ORF Transcript_9583/g.28750 Transcript_9583/m.28750 type:complete len:469 (+) Transcript_9583:330-1736(+)
MRLHRDDQSHPSRRPRAGIRRTPSGRHGGIAVRDQGRAGVHEMGPGMRAVRERRHRGRADRTAAGAGRLQGVSLSQRHRYHGSDQGAVQSDAGRAVRAHGELRVSAVVGQHGRERAVRGRPRHVHGERLSVFGRMREGRTAPGVRPRKVSHALSGVQDGQLSHGPGVGVPRRSSDQAQDAHLGHRVRRLSRIRPEGTDRPPRQGAFRYHPRYAFLLRAVGPERRGRRYPPPSSPRGTRAVHVGHRDDPSRRLPAPLRRSGRIQPSRGSPKDQEGRIGIHRRRGFDQPLRVVGGRPRPPIGTEALRRIILGLHPSGTGGQDHRGRRHGELLLGTARRGGVRRGPPEGAPGMRTARRTAPRDTDRGALRKRGRRAAERGQRLFRPDGQHRGEGRGGRQGERVLRHRRRVGIGSRRSIGVLRNIGRKECVELSQARHVRIDSRDGIEFEGGVGTRPGARISSEDQGAGRPR